MLLVSSPPHLLPAISRWLKVCLILVVCMVALGGITRLTESGLSIVEWKLVSGTLPPMNDTAWHTEFEEYKTSPQFKKVNSGFTVADFKTIYWLEYLHRLLGRVIGAVVVLGTIYFGMRGIPRPVLRRLLFISALVGAQGTVGWIMVASGLVDQPRVAPVKLGLHLLLAFTVFVVLLWTFWQVRGDARPLAARRLAIRARAVLLFVTLQIWLGALVAGLRAGKSYNTYPLMDGQWVPDGLYTQSPHWLNHLENITTVQFQHRMGALAVVLLALWLCATARRHAGTRRLTSWLIATVTVQFFLGVLTLLSVVNLWIASAHQLVALALVALLVRLLYLTPLDANQRF